MGEVLLSRLTLLLSLLLSLATCSRRSDAAKPADADPVTYVTGNDRAMNGAIAPAQATLDVFKGALAAAPPGALSFSVKVGFPYGAHGREHIWLVDVTLTGSEVTGKINNEPVDAKNLKLGQIVTAPQKDISDWMYVDGGVLRGGYTLRVLLDKMSPGERKKTLAEMGDVRLE